MDIQKERESFENWYIRNMDINSDFEKISEQDSPYMDEHVNDSWLTWQAAKAQAVPEGFVVVPKEPTREMLIAADNCEIDGKVTAHNIYKAMIAAVQEPNND